MTVIAMKYASIKDLRTYLGFHPIKVENESLQGVVDGSNREFYTQNKPLVDFDYDGEVIDDVKVLVNGAEVTIESIDEEMGKIVLASAPEAGSTVVATYYWHPFGDSELQMIIEAAESEIDNECGRSFEAQERTERILMTRGNVFHVSYTPIISISEVVIEDISGEEIETLSSDKYEILVAGSGLVRLKEYYAGLTSPPWYLPSRFYVKITYTGGYQTIPSIIKQATILIASYHLLTKIAHLVTTEPDYRGKISVAFKKPQELTERLEYLRTEIERVKSKLPHAIGVA